MVESTPADSPTERPPLGSWPRLYTLCCVLAVVVMVLLYWFTSHYNVPAGR
jgi:hypothetical protein